MAAVGSGQVTTIKVSGVGQIVEWLEINNVTTADTIDVASIGTQVYKKVEAAAFFGRAQGTAVAATVSGTVITMTSAGMANDTVEMLILGDG